MANRCNRFFIIQFANKYRRENIAFSANAKTEIEQYAWPGNIRELAHCVERAVLVSLEDHIQPKDLGLQQTELSESYETMTLEEAEKQLILKALQRNENNVASASEQLGVSRNALYRRMEKYGIDIVNA